MLKIKVNFLNMISNSQDLLHHELESSSRKSGEDLIEI